MITKEKLDIYKLFEGDIDLWLRAGNKKQKKLIDEKDWFLIDDLLQDIKMLSSTKVSEEYVAVDRTKVKQSCDNKSTINELENISLLNY